MSSAIGKPKVEKSDAEWREQLTPEEYQVLRKAGTERPFTGEYDETFTEGVYHCRACDAELLRSDTKFASHCEWPSFYAPSGDDNVIRRLGVARTIWAARQIVGHGHVQVNGRKTDISSAIVKPGDTITFKEGIHKVLRDNMEMMAGHNVPNWLEWNPAQLTAKINALPTPEDVPFEVNMNLIIEFYR